MRQIAPKPEGAGPALHDNVGYGGEIGELGADCKRALWWCASEVHRNNAAPV